MGGVYDQAQVKKEFNRLEKENEQLFNYAKTLYWTLLNYLCAYRNLSTNLLKGNANAERSAKEGCFINGMKGASMVGKGITSVLPLTGGLLGALDIIIDIFYELPQNISLSNKVNIVNKFII